MIFQKEVGIYPKIISAAREINESMSSYLASQVLDNMIKNQLDIRRAKVLVLGLTFKENCPDIRNSKVFSMINNLKDLSLNVTAHDPYVDKKEIKEKFDIDIIKSFHKSKWDVIIIAVKHNEYIKMTYKQLSMMLNKNSLVFDIKGARPIEEGFIRL